MTRSNFNLNGNNTVVDSFDSSDVNYSTGGQYDATKRKANGSIATDSSINDAIRIGQGNIYGHVLTGPGTLQSEVQVGNNGAVGDAAWNNGGNIGIQPGAWSGDFNMNIPDVPTPSFSGLGVLPVAIGGFINLSGSYIVSSVQSTTSNIKGTNVL